MILEKFNRPEMIRLIEASIPAVHADAAAVWVLDEQNQAFRIQKNFGIRGPEIEGMLLDVSQGVVSAAFTSGTEQIEQDGPTHPNRSMKIDVTLVQRTTAQGTFPLKSGSHVVAVITFVQLFQACQPRNDFGFSANDLELMRAVCQLIST